ncbi:hypothetical protein PIB30_011419 [Stylosanthes scabra]|uniref:Transmembrane protein n=1 Tax=Stylosanthes scabra TaxID=79078 RepID=A0ABU6Q6H6_9FABA|nr:hypothetical protein [Stylosanthes scabra]
MRSCYTRRRTPRMKKRCPPPTPLHLRSHAITVFLNRSTFFSSRLLLDEEFQVCFFRRRRSYVVHLSFFAPLLAVILLYFSGSGSWLFSSTLHEGKVAKRQDLQETAHTQRSHNCNKGKNTSSFKILSMKPKNKPLLLYRQSMKSIKWRRLLILSLNKMLSSKKLIVMKT